MKSFNLAIVVTVFLIFYFLDNHDGFGEQDEVIVFDKDFGTMKITPAEIVIQTYQTEQVTISGKIENTTTSDLIYLNVTGPDRVVNNQSYGVTKDGHFQAILLFDKTDPIGRYQVQAFYKSMKSSIAFFQISNTENISNIVSIAYQSSIEGCEIFKECYSPTSISIPFGNSVLWQNADIAPHTITSGSPKSGLDHKFDSKLMSPGKTFSHVFTESDTFQYFCTIHPWMVGQVIVEKEISIVTKKESEQPLEVTETETEEEEKRPESLIMTNSGNSIGSIALTPKGYPVMTSKINNSTFGPGDMVKVDISFSKSVKQDIRLKIFDSSGNNIVSEKLKIFGTDISYEYPITKKNLNGLYTISANVYFGNEPQDSSHTFSVTGISNPNDENQNVLSSKDVEKNLESDIANQSKKGGGCLIATAAYGTEFAPQVQQLRELRDNTLLKTSSGAAFMAGFNSIYYSFSPTIADWERENPVFKQAIQTLLTPLLASLSILKHVDVDSEEMMLGYGLGIIFLNIGIYFLGPAIAVIKIRKILRESKSNG